ncbi:MAG: heme o synthase [Haloarculaceae archaeon]
MSFTRPRFGTLLAASALGVYVLVVAGATAAVADAVSACSTWPTCQGSLADPSFLVAVTHRLLAAGVGVLVLLASVSAFRTDVEGRVRAALAGALALYPVQIAIGAFVATTGASGELPVAHFTVGMGIFAALVAALAWHLEAETGSDDAGPVLPGDAADAPVEGGEPAPAPALTRRQRLVETARAYVRLTKPRLMWLLCLVAAAAMALAGGPGLSVRTIVLTLGGGVLAIGASGTFNHVLERDVDQRMDRTSDRPVATHQIPVRNALAFGAVLALASVGSFLLVNPLTALLGVVAILFYSVVYTLVLKPNTVQNTVIGGAAGALPALIGWAAVTGTVGLPGVVLAGVVFLWTPAHFYNLALAYKEDYARGGFPMMPVVRGETQTRKHVLYYLGATLAAAGVLVALSGLGPLYAATTAGLGGVFLWAVVRLHREQTDRAALRAFHASNAYLGALLLVVVIDALAV